MLSGLLKIQSRCLPVQQGAAGTPGIKHLSAGKQGSRIRMGKKLYLSEALDQLCVCGGLSCRPKEWGSPRAEEKAIRSHLLGAGGALRCTGGHGGQQLIQEIVTFCVWVI